MCVRENVHVWGEQTVNGNLEHSPDPKTKTSSLVGLQGKGRIQETCYPPGLGLTSAAAA